MNELAPKIKSSLNLSSKKILLLLIANCTFLIGCNQELIDKWTKINNRFPNVELAKKGENGVRGNYLIEKSPNPGSSNRENEYYLKTSKGQTYPLALGLKKWEYQILYFEFTENSLFIIINSYAPRDWISFKSFDLETGKLILSDGGEIPCRKKYTIKYDWNLGNRDCDWIDIQSKQITYTRTSPVKSNIEGDSLSLLMVELKIFSYDWSDNKIDTVVQYLSPEIDAFTGGLLNLENIRYDQEKGKFKSPNAH
ncbi:MAG: hypothetical protein AB8H47_18475 [Bacteroidia bacterium]